MLDTKTLWYKDTSNSDAFIEDDARLYFPSLSKDSVGVYTCIALPNMGDLGSSKVQLSIQMYKANSLKITYLSYDTDPFSKRIIVPSQIGDIHTTTAYVTKPETDLTTEIAKKTTTKTKTKQLQTTKHVKQLAKIDINKVPILELIFEKPKATLINIGDEVEIVCNVKEDENYSMNSK